MNGIIKTIWYQANYNEDFDKEINKAIEEGYEVKQIELVNQKTENKMTMLFALLEKPAAAEQEKQPAPADEATLCEKTGHDFMVVDLDCDFEFINAYCLCKKCGKALNQKITRK